MSSLLAVGCGARSELDDLHPPAGAQGGAGAGGTAVVGPCAQLTQSGAPALVLGAQTFAQSLPTLIGAAEEAVLGHAIDDVEGGPRFTFERFSPWGAWPPSLVYARPNGTIFHTHAIAGGGGPLGPSVLLNQSPDADPFLLTKLEGEGLALAFSESTPLFVTSNEQRWLTSFKVPFDNQVYLFEVQPGFEVDFRLDWGCGSTPTYADALPLQDGSFLVALSSGTAFGGCGVPGGVGPTTRLQLARFDQGFASELLFERDHGEPLSLIRLAPRSDGVWLVTRTDGSTARTSPGAYAYRFSTVGAEQGEGVQVVPDGTAFNFIGAASLADGLAVAYVAGDGASPTLEAHVVDANGGLGSTITASVAIAPGPISVLGDPAGDAFLVAYTTAESQVAVVRFECSGEP